MSSRVRNPENLVREIEVLNANLEALTSDARDVKTNTVLSISPVFAGVILPPV